MNTSVERKCGLCGGKGDILYYSRIPYDDWRLEWCPNCNGRGTRLYEEPRDKTPHCIPIPTDRGLKGR